MRFTLLAMLMISPVCGCAAPARTTRLTTDDLEQISAEIAQQFAASELFTRRTRNSPMWVIAIRKVENLTSDIMTQAEKWYVMERFRASAPIEALRAQKNIRFVLPAAKRRAVREHFKVQEETPGFGNQRAPTHVMEGVFRSVTRATSRGRTELYYFEATLVDLSTGEPIWSGRFEYKRAAREHVWD